MALLILVRAVSKWSVLAGLLACMQIAHAETQTLLPGTYSSLAYSDEGGDLIGYEVRVIPTNQGLKAVVQVSEGDAGRIYIVDVEQDAKTIGFDVPLASGMRGRFVGEATRAGLTGAISFPSGEKQEVVLKRTISYWERATARSSEKCPVHDASVIARPHRRH